MGKPLTGAVRAADEGLFDLGARAQMDWLDEPGGAKAKPMQDARVADLRRMAALDNRAVTLIDENGVATTKTLIEALDEMDEFDAFADAIATCAMRTPA